MKHTVRMAALVGAVAVVAAACGQAPSAEPAGSGATTSANASAASFNACMVTDSGGIDDRSFNASGWKGLQDAEQQLGIKARYVESKTDADYAPNVNQMVQGDCNIIVTVGFLLGDATAKAAAANPDEKFAIVDFSYDKPVKNVKPLVFDTAQAAFLAGYVAAGMTKTGKVATFGGINIPTVSIFMDGFAGGIEYYNKQKSKDVKLLGWDPANPKAGSFTGDFENQDNGKRLTTTFIGQGADIIFPVAGPVGLGAAAAAQASGGKANLVWVDTDGFVSAPQYKSLFITSVVKAIDKSVFDVTKATLDGKYSGDPYVGTLDNEGVSIAPYHEFDSKVPADLKSEVDAIKAKIISGELKAESPSSPKS